MAVEVYFWPMSFSDGNVGHAAMKVDGGSPAGEMYLSRWPGKGIVFGGIVGGPGGAAKSYADDVKAEGGPALIVRMTKLDETAIKTRMTISARANIYSLLVLNCASQVKLCLDAGITGGLVSSVFTSINALPMTPRLVYTYANQLARFYR